MKTLSLCLVAVALVAGCGGGGGIIPSNNTLVGGTWHWTAYETNGGTRTFCTAAPQPSPCGNTWAFSGSATAGTLDNGNGTATPWTLANGTLTFPNESTSFRWISANEFAERRAGNPDWEIWTR